MTSLRIRFRRLSRTGEREVDWEAAYQWAMGRLQRVQESGQLYTVYQLEQEVVEFEESAMRSSKSSLSLHHLCYRNGRQTFPN